MRCWWWTASLLCACNQVWQLDMTELVEDFSDTDGDGVVDQVDVCIDVPDPAQLDGDGDGLGDACDPCPTGSNHDEDGDGLLDGCDNCPQIMNIDQANDDGDDLGNVCDHDAGSQRRILFDGFGTLSDDWVQGIIGWASTDDAATPTRDGAPDADLWNLRKRVDGTSFYVEVGMTVVDAQGAYGIQGHTPGGAAEFICVVRKSSLGMWEIQAKSAVKALTGPPQGVFTLRLRRSQTMMHCEIDGVADAATIDNLSTGTQPGIQSSSTTKFTYLDAVSGP